MRIFLALLLGSALLAASAAAATTPYLDLDFEAAGCSGSWFLGGRGYDNGIDATQARSGKQSLRFRYTGTGPWDQGVFGVATQAFPVEAAAGKKIRYSAWIKTEGVEGSHAGLWWRVDGEGRKTLAFDNMSGRGPKGTTDWTRYQIEMEVPKEATGIYFGALLVGSGTAWFDGATIEIDGVRWAEGPPPSYQPPSEAAAAWLKARVLPFNTAEAGNGFADLQPLKKLVGDARIVSLGEGTHGTREFFQMKHRLTEWLASEMGFTLFAIEANMPEAYRLNDYVLTGKGDPKELIKGMYFWTWDTQEVLDMVEWMRRFNESGKGRIQFLGFDMQTPDLAARLVRDFVAVADPESASKLGEALDGVVKVKAAQWSRGPKPEGAPEPRTAAEAARGVLKHLETRRESYLARFPASEVDWAIQNARVVVQAAEMYAGETSRDKSMAKNVEWILGQAPKGSKIVLWAHNGHVHRQGDAMGQHLAARYGKEMAVLGFAMGEGRYTAVGDQGLATHDAQPPMPGSVEALFRATGLPRFIVDLRDIPADSPAAPWLTEPHPFRSIGALAMKCAFDATDVASDYDGLIWFDKTSPSVLLRPMGAR